MNNTFLKALVIVVVILYVISPVDAYPGPVDDLVVLLLGFAAKKRIAEN